MRRSVLKSRSRIYLYMAIGLSILCFWGFFGTYFGPLLAGTEARFTHPVDQPVIVHVHGWAVFLWYMLLLAQVALIATGRRALHRTFGQASMALVAIAFVTGCIIIPVNIYLGVRVTESPLWPWFGLLILSAVFLFLIFYLLALKHRRNPEIHKRYMIVASIAALGAAVFRILGDLRGPDLLNVPIGNVLPMLLLLIPMLRDWRVEGRPHRVYVIGFVTLAVVNALTIALPHTPIWPPIETAFVNIGEGFLVFYGTS